MTGVLMFDGRRDRWGIGFQAERGTERCVFSAHFENQQVFEFAIGVRLRDSGQQPTADAESQRASQQNRAALKRRGQQRHSLASGGDVFAVGFEGISLMTDFNPFGLQVAVQNGDFLSSLSIGFDEFPRGFRILASLLLELFDLLLLPSPQFLFLVAARQGQHEEQHQEGDQCAHRRISVE